MISIVIISKDEASLDDTLVDVIGQAESLEEPCEIEFPPMGKVARALVNSSLNAGVQSLLPARSPPRDCVGLRAR